MLNAFLRHPIASQHLSVLKPADFYSYRNERLKKVKPGTVNRELGIVKHALDVAALEWGLPLGDNSLAKVKKMKVQNSRTRRLLPDELQILQAESGNTRNPYIMSLVYFALETAMRRGEILAMKWQDIDFRNKTLYIPITKNGYSRTIPLTTGAINILQELQSENQK
jgi:integrase